VESVPLTVYIDWMHPVIRSTGINQTLESCFMRACRSTEQFLCYHQPCKTSVCHWAFQTETEVASLWSTANIIRRRCDLHV